MSLRVDCSRRFSVSSSRSRASVRGSALSASRSEEHTSELQSRLHLVCRLLLETKNIDTIICTAGYFRVESERLTALPVCRNYRVHTALLLLLRSCVVVAFR